MSFDPCFLADDFLRDADTAMYRAKAQGRARHQRFDVRMREQAVERVTIESELRQALEKGELLLHYQPFVSLLTGKVVGAEALIRWQHPERGLLGPGAFLPVAEESGLIVPMAPGLPRPRATRRAPGNASFRGPFAFTSTFRRKSSTIRCSANRFARTCAAQISRHPCSASSSSRAVSSKVERRC